MSKLRTADRTGWVIALLGAVVLVMTFLATPSMTSSADARVTLASSSKISCDTNKWSKYIGIGTTRVLARMDIRMHACWRHIHLKKNPGMVLKKKSSLHVNIYNTSVGSFHGATWIMQEKWKPAGFQNRFRITKEQHIGLRQCLSLAGQKVCGPTADFSVGGTFNSPYISKKWAHSDGSVPRWKFVWFEGEPGQAPGSFDDNVWICNTMCR
jgi:hypothetical protein